MALDSTLPIKKSADAPQGTSAREVAAQRWSAKEPQPAAQAGAQAAAPASSVAPKPLEVTPAAAEVTKSTPRARAFSFVALCATVAGLGYLANTGYRLLTDSFVAPMVLSPDSPLVQTNMLTMSQLQMDRSTAVGQANGIEAELASDEKGIARLTELEKVDAKALAWTKDMNNAQNSAGNKDLGHLSNQAGVLSQMISKQQQLTEMAQKNLAAGVITRTDYMAEEQKLNDLRLSYIQTARTRNASELNMHAVTLGDQSLNGKGEAPPMPQIVSSEDQLGRVEVQLLRLIADKQQRLAERKALQEKIAKIDDLETQFKGKPLFDAISKNVDVAFVPYSQLAGVTPGAQVYTCVWGVFSCKMVGRVATVVPGEAKELDPWGFMARGQYAVLDLTDHESAKGHLLRVRPGTGSQPSTANAAAPGNAPGNANGNANNGASPAK
jgi:hypothetical protein